MSQLIDLCGTPIQIEKVKSFRLVKREFLFYPAYKEIEQPVFSLFATRKSHEEKKKFVFTTMVPFGALLSDKEKPAPGSYEIKSFGEVITANVLAEVGKAIENMAGLAADWLKLDTSGNKEFRVLTEGRRTITIRLRDVPAKVAFLSGKVGDVYKHDPIYSYLGEPIAPTIVAIPTLVVVVDKTSHVFFGGGVDLDDAEATYKTLLEAYNQYQASEKKNRDFLPKFNVNIPKLNMPSIKIQSPFVIRKNETKLLESSEELSNPDALDKK